MNSYSSKSETEKNKNRNSLIGISSLFVTIIIAILGTDTFKDKLHLLPLITSCIFALISFILAIKAKPICNMIIYSSFCLIFFVLAYFIICNQSDTPCIEKLKSVSFDEKKDSEIEKTPETPFYPKKIEEEVPKLDVKKPTLPNYQTISKYRKDMKKYIKEDYLLNLTINGKSGEKITCKKGETIQIEIKRDPSYDDDVYFHIVRCNSNKKMSLITNFNNNQGNYDAIVFDFYEEKNTLKYSIKAENDYEIILILISKDQFQIRENLSLHGEFNNLNFINSIKDYLNDNGIYHQLIEIDIK